MVVDVDYGVENDLLLLLVYGELWKNIEGEMLKGGRYFAKARWTLWFHGGDLLG